MSAESTALLTKFTAVIASAERVQYTVRWINGCACVAENALQLCFMNTIRIFNTDSESVVVTNLIATANVL